MSMMMMIMMMTNMIMMDCIPDTFHINALYINHYLLIYLLNYLNIIYKDERLLALPVCAFSGTIPVAGNRDNIMPPQRHTETILKFFSPNVW